MSFLHSALPDVPATNIIQCNAKSFFSKTGAHQRSTRGFVSQNTPQYQQHILFSTGAEVTIYISS
jgi:hypothetical protein